MIVYQGEKHTRGTARYTVVTLIVAGAVILSLMTGNWTGVLLLLFLLGGYFFYSTYPMEQVTLSVDEQGLMIGDQRHTWTEYEGYVLESPNDTVNNLVLIRSDGHDIHTIDPTTNDRETITTTLTAIDTQLPALTGYRQTFVELLMRRLKI